MSDPVRVTFAGPVRVQFPVLLLYPVPVLVPCRVQLVATLGMPGRGLTPVHDPLVVQVLNRANDGPYDLRRVPAPSSAARFDAGQ
jgi:hypothetical protein